MPRSRELVSQHLGRCEHDGQVLRGRDIRLLLHPTLDGLPVGAVLLMKVMAPLVAAVTAVAATVVVAAAVSFSDLGCFVMMGDASRCHGGGGYAAA